MIDRSIVVEWPECGKLYDAPVTAMHCVVPVPLDLVHPAEIDAIANAGSKRRSDFVAGRACAHACLAALHIPDLPISVGELGMPVWPEGVIGSISHADGICAAVALLSGAGHAVGLDIEVDRAVTAEMEAIIFTEAESAILCSLPTLERSRTATILFSAKEAFYKAQFPLSRSFLDYRDVSATIADGKFEATLRRDVARVGSRGDGFSGRYAISGGHVLTGILL